jgi:sulfur carrier protein
LIDVLVTLNGRTREVPDGCSVEHLIRHAELDPRFVIVEHNGEPVERKRYADVIVAAGDRLELVRAVAGG